MSTVCSAFCSPVSSRKTISPSTRREEDSLSNDCRSFDQSGICSGYIESNLLRSITYVGHFFQPRSRLSLAAFGNYARLNGFTLKLFPLVMLRKTLHSLFIARRKEIPFIILFAFISTFLIARLVVYLIYHQVLPPMFMYVSLRGEVVHVHHLTYGIIIISVVGFIAIALPNILQKRAHTLSYLYGIGLGLIVDEFALWLQLEDNYFHRISYDAFITVTALLLLIVYFRDFQRWFTTKLLKRGIAEIK